VRESLAFSLTTHSRERLLCSGLSSGLDSFFEIVVFEPEQKGDRLAVSRKHDVLFFAPVREAFLADFAGRGYLEISYSPHSQIDARSAVT
jgi:hypothetical protein